MRKLELITALEAIDGNPFIVFPALPADEAPGQLYYDVESLIAMTTISHLDDTVYESIALRPEEIVEEPNVCEA